MQGTGTLLARLGGADPDVLDRAKQISKAGAAKDKARFVALGLVLLATASLAVLSMTFAMADGLHIEVATAVVMGVFWGVIILIVDRALILNLKPKGSRWLLFWMILPRVVMAALLGLVISTPLTLRIFNDEIQQQMTVDQITDANKAQAELSDGELQAALKAKEEEVTKARVLLNGVGFTYTDPVLAAAQTEYDAANQDWTDKTKAKDDAYNKWQCELYGGPVCVTAFGVSGRPGNGNLAQAMEQQYHDRETEANQARNALDLKQQVLTDAQTKNRAGSSGALEAAKADARKQLETLVPQWEALSKQVEKLNKRAVGEQKDGLLAQLVALSHLGDANGWARTAHLLVAGLLFMLELLPVAVKSLSLFGPPTAYDQVDDIDTKEVVRAAGRQGYIDKDLEKRKERIAKAVHDEVEDVMRDLAIDEVKRWRAKVQQQVGSSTVQQGSGPTSNTSVWSTAGSGGSAATGGVPGQRPSAARKVVAPLNLPPSSTYGTP